LFVVTGGEMIQREVCRRNISIYYIRGQMLFNYQTAINNANNGDTINVANGTYTEDLDITKSITLKSINGYANTTDKRIHSDIQ
jgi:hypothetical protein